jgi:hypothetical protein
VSPLTAAALVTAVLLVLGISACGGSNPATGTTASRAVAVKAREAAAAVIRKFGSKATPSQARQAEAVVHAYLGARASSEWGKACSYLTPERRSEFSRVAHSKQIKGNGCADLLALVTKELSSTARAGLGKAEVTSVRVGKGRGYVIYTDAGAEYATPMRLEGGEWKVAGIQPRSLKP